MLVRFIVSNFLSFKEETEFNMLAAVDQKHHKDHIYKRNSLDLLKTAALYGANGAGKSNLIKAIDLLRSIVVAGGENSLLNIKGYKLSTESQSLPTSLEIEFIKNGIPFLFGLKASNTTIDEEWLYISGLGKEDDKILFHRTTKDGIIDIKFSEIYYQEENSRIHLEFIKNNLVKSDSLLFKILFDLKEEYQYIKEAYEWFTKNILLFFPDTKPGALLVEAMLNSDFFNEFANFSMRSFQTGISAINIKTFPYKDFVGRIRGSAEEIKNLLKKNSMVPFAPENGSEGIIAMMENNQVVIKRFVSEHIDDKGNPIDFFLEDESDGTNRLLEITPAFFQLLNSESVVLIDEIDQSIHPVLLKDLVSKSVSDEKTKGQFIFTTHEANLLDQSIFRRDEIWFVEKDKGETKLYPLSDFDIRYDLDIRKGYLNGRFGAIPFMGDLQNLNWDQYAEAE